MRQTGTTERAAAVKRYALFAALRSVAYVALAFLLVFYCTPTASADDGEGDPIDVPTTDFTPLHDAIASAEAAAGAYPVIDADPGDVDEGVQYVTSGALGALQGAIAEAQGVAGNAEASQGDVDAQVGALGGAQDAFFASVLVGSKVEVPEPQPDAVIEGISIFVKDTDDCLGTNLGDYTKMYEEVAEKAHITQKAGALELDYVVRWSDGSTSSRTDGNATWWSSDPSIASFNSSRLEPHKDGTVTIRAIANADKTGGAELYAEATVKVDGQDDTLYVEAIRIISPEGANITNSDYRIEEDLSTAQAQFMAEVDVVDPASNTTTTYTTNGELSKQVPELGDLAWSVGDPALGSIIESTGTFRPSRYAPVAIIVSSLAGFGGAAVTANAIVSTVNPDGEEQGDEYHPQDSLTILAYYELQPPAEYGEDAYVINRTYTPDDLQGLGSLTGYYTAFSTSGDYYTMQGTGVPLSSVLRESGVNIDGIKSFAFRTADWPSGENRPVTASFVFADRYYYPNIDVGSFTDAVQVFPILAWSSSQIRNSTNLDIPMTEATRFRLLFGATPAGGNSQYQIKWINTIVVVLSGGPAADPGDGDGDGGGGNVDPDPGKDSDAEQGDGTEGAGDHQTGGDGGGENRGEGTGDAATTGNVGGGAAAGGQGQGQDDPGVATDDPDVANPEDAGAVNGVGGTSGGAEFRVYQVMNKNASDTDTELEIENPYAPYTVPLGVAVVGIGGLESLLWFRFQRQGALVAANAAAAA